MSDKTRRRPVIVAEDMAVEREGLEQFLSDHGYDVQAVSHPDDIKDLPTCLALLMDVKFGADRFLGLEYVVQKRQRASCRRARWSSS